MTDHSTAQSSAPSMNRIGRFAWFVVGYVGAVILFGAVVRVTGSGAGCGEHWPTCQGEVVHLPRTIETAIELSHRLTSGLSLVFVLWLFWLVRRNFEQGHPTRRFAGMAVAFLIIESLIGAVLVLFGLVVGDRSMARAVMMPIHLANASLLMASLCLTAYAARRKLPEAGRVRNGRDWQLITLLGALLAASMLGALTALGDTLFPPDARAGVWHHLAADQSSRAHWLEHLRVIHPAFAIAVALFAIRVALGPALGSEPPYLRRVARGLIASVCLQLVAGTVNVALNAPAFMQIVHLGLALLVFNLAVLLWAAGSESMVTAKNH